MPLSLTDRAPEVAMKTAGGAAARGDGALRRQPDGSAAESTAGHAPERTRFAAGGRKFGRWGSGLGQLFALAAGLREGAAGSASVLSQSAKMRSYIYYESLATAPRIFDIYYDACMTIGSYGSNFAHRDIMPASR